jgi:hypothetical protein
LVKTTRGDESRAGADAGFSDGAGGALLDRRVPEASFGPLVTVEHALQSASAAQISQQVGVE